MSKYRSSGKLGIVHPVHGTLTVDIPGEADR